MGSGRGSVLRTIIALTTVAVFSACGGEQEAGAGAEPEASAAAPAEAMPTVTIVSPADGDTVPAGALTVNLEVSGVTIAMAGDTTPGTGHHHLFLDRDVSAPDIPVPAEPGFIVHMGNGAASYTFENVAPGEHRLIAVVADGLHYPLQPWVVDTVRFVAR